jgi:D-alanyl-D-alanine-carboxypeptidase/D-alanyl-D-alanine-endopeptidase
MTDTSAAPTPVQCARLLAPDAARALPACGDESGRAASGGVYSTANDMARWLAHQLAPNPSGDERRIGQAVYWRRDQLAYASGIDHSEPASGVGLAWIELPASDAHPRLLEKTGGGDGFMTYVVIDPARRVGLFLAIDREGAGRLNRLASEANDLVAQLGSTGR